MNNCTKLYQRAAKFFLAFARTEYALKATGFHLSGDGDAKTDWSKFAKEVDCLIEKPDTKLSPAINFIFAHPPKKQIIREVQLAWCTACPTGSCKADNLLIYVRRVRNNLFHGGKFNSNRLEPERSEQLIEHSLTILKSCVAHVPDVNKAYQSWKPNKCNREE